MNKIQRINDDNKEVELFYENILNEVNKLLEDKKNEEAIKIINEELEQPYMPYKYFDIFNDKKFEIIQKIMDVKYEEKFWNKTPSELLNIIYRSNINIIEYWEMFVLKLEETEDNISNYHNQLELILTSNNIDNFNKLRIIDYLNSLEYDKDIKFLNNNLLKFQTIKPNLIDYLFNELGYSEVSKILNEKTFKDISKQHFCNIVLNDIFEYYFPFFEFESKSSLVDSILEYVQISLDNKFDEKNKSEDAKELYKVEKVYLNV